jgi:hypothetical protein
VYLTAAVTIFVLWDAGRRRAARVLWTIATLALWPIVLPIWLAVRPLRRGEQRRGGRAWMLLRSFALTWTLLWGSHLVVTVGVGTVVAGTSQTRAERDSGLSMIVLVGAIFGVIWLLPALGALLLGLLLRRPEALESGPDDVAVPAP